MPTATDLVTDLPADFEVFGQAVDTRLKALQPGTTLGDLAYSSATANTNTRLGIGTTGQVLTVAGGVPSWATASAGGMTLLSTTSLSGVATVTISSINQTYNEIQIWCDGMKSTDNNIGMRVNGSSSAIYRVITLGTNNASIGALQTQLSQVNQLQDAAQPGLFRMTCKGYTETDSQKIIVNNATGRNSTGLGAVYNQANYINVGAITSVTFYTEDTAANFTAGSIRIYGVK
jgi:hypothetical protein